ncbi:MAG: tetratricopeptide repeat protein, partial [Archangium sp.]|nr:tetratricopeptide repeat protein [Archangium sp.]
MTDRGFLTLRALAVAGVVAACASTPESKPDMSTPPAETGEVPYTPKTATPTTTAPAPTQAETAPTAEAPAAAGEAAPAAPAKPATPPPPPKYTFSASTQNHFKDGTAALEKGDLAAAERTFKDVLANEPKADHAATNLGLIAERRGDLREAEAQYRRGIAIDSANTSSWDALARLLCRTKRCSQADTET